jgi:hypothetical protein
MTIMPFVGLLGAMPINPEVAIMPMYARVLEKSIVARARLFTAAKQGVPCGAILSELNRLFRMPENADLIVGTIMQAIEDLTAIRNKTICSAHVGMLDFAINNLKRGLEGYNE